MKFSALSHRLVLLIALVVGLASAGCGSDNGSQTSDYDVTVSVVSDAGDLGALQFNVSYEGESGGWSGTAGNIDCEALIDALMAVNDSGASSLKIGVVSLEGVPTPGDVVRCVFRGPDELSTSSFVVRVLDASDTDSVRVMPVPTMQVTSVVAR